MRQQGFGIPELLVGIAVGMIIVAAAVQMLFTTLRNSNDNIKMARLEQDLRQTMQMVTRDLRRATTWDTTMDVARVALAAPLTLSDNSGDVTVSSSATRFSVALRAFPWSSCSSRSSCSALPRLSPFPPSAAGSIT